MAIWLTVTECGCTEIVDDYQNTLHDVLVAETSTDAAPVLLLSEDEKVFVPES